MEGWRQHYRIYSHKAWKDGSILNNMIAEYERLDIDGDLYTAEERARARRPRASHHKPHRPRKSAQASSPIVPKRSSKATTKRRRTQGDDDDDDDDYEDRVRPRKSAQRTPTTRRTRGAAA